MACITHPMYGGSLDTTGSCVLWQLHPRVVVCTNMYNHLDPSQACTSDSVFVCVCVCTCVYPCIIVRYWCVCACVCVREREREHACRGCTCVTFGYPCTCTWVLIVHVVHIMAFAYCLTPMQEFLWFSSRLKRWKLTREWTGTFKQAVGDEWDTMCGCRL